MARVVDSTETFTIALMIEGLGIIKTVDVTVGTDVYTYDVGTATWTPSAPLAHADDAILVGPVVKNEGGTQDTIWTELSSPQTPITEPIREGLVDVGMDFTPSYDVLMPAVNLTLTLDAGHVE